MAAGVALALGAQSEAWAQKGRKISVGDDPSVKNGSPDLVLIEAMDYQCLVCRHGVVGVLSQVYENYVRTGKVELVYLDFPLQRHSNAFKAAEAAGCADDQDNFYYMHHELFDNQNALGPDQLSAYAEELGLDMAAFQNCLSSGKHAPAIREDIHTIQGFGITGTPAFLIGRRLPDGDKVQILKIMQGLPPSFEEFEKVLGPLLPKETPSQP